MHDVSEYHRTFLQCFSTPPPASSSAQAPASRSPPAAWKAVPRSSRLQNRQRPCPSHHRILIRSPRRPRIKRAIMRVEAQHGLNLRRRCIKALSHIRHAAGQIDEDIPRCADHGKTDRIRRSRVASTSQETRSFTPLGSSTSTIPTAGVAAGASTNARAGKAGGSGAIETGINRSAHRCGTACAKCRTGRC
jgi:hypothetical protein